MAVTTGPIPCLEEYGISEECGFLPASPPLERLPNPYFQCWENAIHNFNHLLLAGKLREIIRKFPVLDTSVLSTEAELQRAFVVLSILTHGYVWGKQEPISEMLPPMLAIPFCAVAERLEMSPVVCNAAVVTWNWKILDPEGPLDLSNLATLHTFTGSIDESWFYLITTAIEGKSGRCLTAILNAMHAIEESSDEQFIYWMRELASAMEEIRGILIRMYDKCDPYIFYWKVRAYLAGWKNMADAGLPHGVLYQGVDDLDLPKNFDPSQLTQRYRKYAGGSAGQSGLVHALDVALGVHHDITVESTNSADEEEKELAREGQHTNFFNEMRQYMPGKHRKFLEALERAPSIHKYVMSRSKSILDSSKTEAATVVEAFNECLDQLKLFRNSHIQMVTRYIVLPAKKGPAGTPIGVGMVDPANPTTQPHSQQQKHHGMGILYPQTSPIVSGNAPPPHGLARLVGDEKIVRGTGGTDVIPFLKQARDDVVDTKIVTVENRKINNC
ncbi:tryptophan 2,3- dioxygenase [Basidiobolus ranarum]|uniref:Tryptophan 2,3- dioxygenase n=1 Tax=Basidiobolus ranarum TaxID=34480 RepID=A0ABR2VUI6_9FUNG